MKINRHLQGAQVCCSSRRAWQGVAESFVPLKT